MSIKATVNSQGSVQTARLTPQKSLQVTNYQINASNIQLGDLNDIDTSGKTDGAMLVYNGTTQKFEATTEIESPNTQFNGGHF